MITRVATADLTFCHMPAPPPTMGQAEMLGVCEMLECFAEDGLAVDDGSLSPIAVVSQPLMDNNNIMTNVVMP